jgi:hypothetical protein
MARAAARLSLILRATAAPEPVEHPVDLSEHRLRAPAARLDLPIYLAHRASALFELPNRTAQFLPQRQGNLRWPSTASTLNAEMPEKIPQLILQPAASS